MAVRAQGEAETQTMSFEDALAELEAIVAQLEAGKGTLEDAIRAYERGDALRRHCAAKLAEAQAKVSRIVETAGTATGTEPLDPET
ncbi:exodeoxyribonuclease VII small subunit [Elioraea sp.]|uniref:exodeoxyribonuclease VII small subunit n=1 Tax=Elioraea sp. TaxID=2185103 RepID=UPI003F72EA8B